VTNTALPRVPERAAERQNVGRGAGRELAPSRAVPFEESRASAGDVVRIGRQEVATEPPIVSISPPAPTPSVSAPHPGMTKLNDALHSLGISTAGLDIRYEEEHVGYPGGSYINRNIVVSSGGKTERFSADLTERNPLVTAAELQKYFNVSATLIPGGVMRHV
jgi:hypothetical protein